MAATFADAGNVAFDRAEYDLFDVPGDLDAIHPSMTRIGRLNNNFGLCEVIPGICQVRGFDLATATFVRGRTGWIVFDVATTAETTRTAWDLLQGHVAEGLPVKAVIYSDTRDDHCGGVRGVISPKDVTSGRVEVIALRYFTQITISENVYAGNAMNRRLFCQLFCQYGLLLPAGQHGFVTQGLDHRGPAGATSLIARTRLASEDIEVFDVDGVPMALQDTRTPKPRGRRPPRSTG